MSRTLVKSLLLAAITVRLSPGSLIFTKDLSVSFVLCVGLVVGTALLRFTLGLWNFSLLPAAPHHVSNSPSAGFSTFEISSIVHDVYHRNVYGWIHWCLPGLVWYPVNRQHAFCLNGLPRRRSGLNFSEESLALAHGDFHTKRCGLVKLSVSRPVCNLLPAAGFLVILNSTKFGAMLGNQFKSVIAIASDVLVCFPSRDANLARVDFANNRHNTL